MADFFTITIGSGKEQQVYKYTCKEDYEADKADGLDGKINGEDVTGFWGGLAADFVTFFNNNRIIDDLTEDQFISMNNKEENQNTVDNTQAQYNSQKHISDSADERIENQKQTIKDIKDENKDYQEDIKSNNKKEAQVNEEINEFKEEQEEKLAEETEKARKELEAKYDPAKHGPDKDAYIEKEMKKLNNKQGEEPTSLEEELAQLKLNTKILEGKISANNNKTSSEQNTTKSLNMFSLTQRTKLVETDSKLSSAESALAESEANEAYLDEKVEEAIS